METEVGTEYERCAFCGEPATCNIPTGWDAGLNRPASQPACSACYAENEDELAAQTIILAAREYLRLRARKIHPDGSFDKAGRFYPSKAEWCTCCNAVRTPSRGFPYSYMTHCRTAEHVAHRLGVAVQDLRRAARQEELAARRAAGQNC